MKRLTILPGILIGCLATLPPSLAEESAAGIEFFEKKIRPLLVENCYKCHNTEERKGGLALETRDALLRGGDSGPALVAGDPEGSLLIKAVRHLDPDLAMPPKKSDKLSEEQIESLAVWVRMGAPDPRTGAPSAAELDQANHWAFQPIQRPAIPEVQGKDRVQTPVDAFILEKLESNGMEPSARADRRTLIRRLSLDVTGLPPSPEEVLAFVQDRSPNAYEKLVDRLLGSPHYGERWARYWLDVARYADTKGYVFEEERRYPYSYTYRDYVIRSFNEDLPFNEFIVQQIAADQLDLGEDKRPLAALGYITLGRRFLNNQHDIIDDRIDVVTRGFMGLTVSCARCHDHKYDPVSIRDYYSLYGVFASSSEPSEKPLLGDDSLPPEYPAYVVERKKREEELHTFETEKRAEIRTDLRQRTGEYLLAAHDTQRLEDASQAEGLARERKLHPGSAQRWVTKLKEWSAAESDPIWSPWFQFAALAPESFSEEAKEVTTRIRSTPGIHPLVAHAFEAESPGSMKEVAERYGKLFIEAEKLWQQVRKEATAGNPPDRLEDEALEGLRQVLYADGSPAHVSDGEIPRLYDVPTGQRARSLKRRVEELDATHPGSPPRAMALQDNATPHTPKVFVRGNPNNHGPEVPRQFLEVLAGENRVPFEKGSGRLEMARAIASDDNPLTPRVLVNRVWMNYFGDGLVRTPSDFGLRSDPPTHPELLDYLAWRFMSDGWSLKKLHRLILLSSTYQQQSYDREEYLEKDPNNERVWKMNRRRLDFESMRDSLLAVAGRMDYAAGGQGVDINREPFTGRRTVYGFIERQNLPGIFRTFDFASPDTSSAQRFSTTVPQQALFMLNSPFVVEQARTILSRPEVQGASEREERIRALYQAAFQRPPSPRELTLGADFLADQELAPAEVPDPPAWKYGHGKLDLASGRLTDFQELPHFTGQAWQGSGTLPDDKLGWLMLNATGGHPGEGLENAVVRRWVAPRDVVVRVTGSLEHDAENGNGVRAHLISQHQGVLGTWQVQRSKEATALDRLELRKGETLDFVVDSLGDLNSDSFKWAPSLRLVEPPPAELAALSSEWKAREDFSGPRPAVQPLTAWEKYAQVLLMSNELVFVD